MKRLIFLMLPLLFMAGCAVGAALPAEPEITPSPSPTFSPSPSPSPRRSRRYTGPAWA